MRRNWAMALSFLYQAFVRGLKLFRLFRSDKEELAVEVVMLRQVVGCAARWSVVQRPGIVSRVESAPHPTPGELLRPPRGPDTPTEASEQLHHLTGHQMLPKPRTAHVDSCGWTATQTGLT
jgi:hypothetical protein